MSFDNITLTGYSSGQYANYEFFTAKMNSSGSFLWAKREGSNVGHDFGNAVTTDGTGNVYVTGSITRKKLNCKTCFPAQELSDIYVVKYNSSGTKQWEKKYANSNSNLFYWHWLQGNDIVLDAAGNPYITGTFWGTVSFASGSGMTLTSMNPDVFIAKLNSSGATQWVRSAGSGNEDAGTCLLADNAGDVYVGGYYSQGTSNSGTTLSFGTSSLSGSGAFVAKYNTSGTLAWAVNQAYTPVAIFHNSASSIDVIHNMGLDEVSVANGTTVNSIPTTSSINGYLMLRDGTKTTGGYFLSGEGCGSAGMGSLSLTSTYACNTNYTEIYHIQYATPSMRQVLNRGNNKESLSVFPNPVQDLLYIKANNHSGIGTVHIYDNTGRAVIMKHIEGESGQIDMQHLPPGVYMLKSALPGQGIKIIKK